jgi:hypothetical protein
LGNPSGALLEGWVCAARGTLELNLGFYEASVDCHQRAGELVSAAGQFGQAANWFGGAATVLAGSGDDARAIETASRALALARRAGAPMTVSFALAVQASALARTDPLRTKALLADAIDAMDQAGSDHATYLTHAGIVAARLGDWALTLRLARRAIPLWHWTAAVPYLLGLFHVSALALADARPDTAARLQGAARRMAGSLANNQGTPDAAPPVAAPSGTGWVTALRREATRRLVATLGDEVLSQRRREGEEMGVDDAVAYALAEIDSALADPSFSQA